MTKKKRVKVLCKNSKCEYMIYEMYDHEGTISYLLFIYILIWFKKKKTNEIYWLILWFDHFNRNQGFTKLLPINVPALSL